MDEALKCLNIAVKVLVRRSNENWDILLTSEEDERALVGSILTAK